MLSGDRHPTSRRAHRRARRRPRRPAAGPPTAGAAARRSGRPGSHRMGSCRAATRRAGWLCRRPPDQNAVVGQLRGHDPVEHGVAFVLQLQDVWSTTGRLPKSTDWFDLQQRLRVVGLQWRPHPIHRRVRRLRRDSVASFGQPRSVVVDGGTSIASTRSRFARSPNHMQHRPETSSVQARSPRTD